MGAHHAPHSSSHAARLAGRGPHGRCGPGPRRRHRLAGVRLGGAQRSHDARDPGIAHRRSAPGAGRRRLGQGPRRRPAPQGERHRLDAEGQRRRAALPTTLPARTARWTTTLPVSDMKADAGHAVSNTKNDIQHAATNWTAAAKGGLTPAEGAAQTRRVANDVQHAVDNGKNDATTGPGRHRERPRLRACSRFLRSARVSQTRTSRRHTRPSPTDSDPVGGSGPAPVRSPEPRPRHRTAAPVLVAGPWSVRCASRRRFGGRRSAVPGPSGLPPLPPPPYPLPFFPRFPRGCT